MGGLITVGEMIFFNWNSMQIFRIKRRTVKEAKRLTISKKEHDKIEALSRRGEILVENISKH